MNRRIFLRGLGGAVVAAPFLGSLRGSGARASAATAPTRLIAMFTQYGCVTNRFFPERSHGALTAADLESTTLAPLSPFASKLLIPRGIRAMNEWTITGVRGQDNDLHVQVAGSYLTCHPVTPNGDRFEAKPIGRSLDHVMAEQLSPGGTPLFMRVGNFNEGPSSAISYSAPETAYPGVGTPLQIFSALSGLFTDGPMNADTYAVARGKSVVDIVRDDLASIERVDMSRSDRTKLEAWKDLLDRMGTVMASAQCNTATAAALGATDENVQAPPIGEGTDPVTAMVTDTLDAADIYSNLAVLAAVCNANPVIFLKYPGLFVFGGLGLTHDSDGIGHRTGTGFLSGPCLPGVLDMQHTIDRYYARKFAHLVEQLDSIDEGDGTVLDNTAAVWFQEVSDGCARNLNNLPIIQAGSAGGYFKTGGAVNVEDGSADLSRGNSESACEDGTVDATTQSTGTPANIATQPINKYYCNLMNALGVKAGADGFPANGGSEEVTHYGMYDRTEDFIGGGTMPPTIHDPGGFDILRA